MYYSIDYYSFTIPVKETRYGTTDETNRHAVYQFVKLLPEEHHHKFGLGGWGIEKGSGFYSVRLRHEHSGVAISFGEINAHLFVELSGRACQNLDALDCLLSVVALTHERCSRIDFAVDLETEASPERFSASRNGSAFKANGTINSPSGQTCYLGSRKSERMARVYRYYEPHPRAALLRVEAEYKGDAAKAMSKHLLETDIRQACLDAHKPFGWSHGAWGSEKGEGQKIPYKAYKPDNASTVRWLYGDVITALRKAIETGLVELDDWLAKLAGDSEE
jgi:hypothetical protein